MDDLIFNELYGDEEKLLQRSELDHKKLVRAYEKTFGTDEGRMVLRHIMDISRVDNAIFTGNSKTFYFLGVQAVGLAIKRKVMEANPEIFFKVERDMWEGEFEAITERSNDH